VQYDIFNGDADGIFALAQLRKSDPKKSTLVTGPKREIDLLTRVTDAENASILVLDISMEQNSNALQQCLKNDNKIRWFDHHRSGDVPSDKRLDAVIDTAPHVCTSILVDAHLKGEQRIYAIAGAYGDNLHSEAAALGEGFTSEEMQTLKDIGETVNYNGYGENLEDLNAHPRDVYNDIMSYDNLFEYAQHSEQFKKIKAQKEKDSREVSESESLYLSTAGSCILLPDSPAASRMSGIYSNELVMSEPDLAHAIFTVLKKNDAYRVSIRAPLNRPEKADVLASHFPNGGGRAKAAGINELPEIKLDEFFTKFEEVFSC
jgi:nanoRNase/pAp phosphatase (c-di-AMP/oligoRNAs hydrolase)